MNLEDEDSKGSKKQKNALTYIKQTPDFIQRFKEKYVAIENNNLTGKQK